MINNYNSFFEDLNLGFLVQGPRSEMLMNNSKVLEFLGITKDQLYGRTSFDPEWNVIHEDGSPFPGQTHPVPVAIETRQSVKNTVMGIYRPSTQDRVWLLVNASPILDITGNVDHVICTFNDITEEIKSKIKNKTIRNLYSFVTQINELMLQANTEEALYNGFCRIGIKVGGFKFACVGLLNEKTGKLVPYDHCGEENGFLSVIKDLSINGKAKRGNRQDIGPAIDLKSVSAMNIETDPQIKDWRVEAKSRGLHSVVFIPVIKFGKPTGIISFYSSGMNYYTETEIELLNGITRNITFQLEYFEKERSRKNLQEETEILNRRLIQSQEVGKIGSWELDLLSKTFWGSDQAKSIYGFDLNKDIYSYEEVICCALDREFLDMELELAIKEGRPYDIEYKIQPNDGSAIKTVHSRGALIRDENGVPVRLSGVITDITRRKKDELEILRLSQVVGQSASIVIITDLKGNIEYVNRKFEDATGYSFDEVSGTPSTILTSKEISNGKNVQIWKTIRSGKVWQGEIHNKRKDGTLYWEHVIISPLKNDKDEIINFVLIIDDITLRKRAEEELLIRENELDQLIEQSPVSYEIYDSNGFTKRVNAAYEKLWGIPREYVIDKYNILESKPIKEGGWLPYFKRVFAGEYIVLPDVRYDTSKDEITKGEGLCKWVSTSAYPIKDENGKVRNIVVLHEDISERKEAEKKYDELFDNSPLPMFLIDIETYCFIKVNKATIALYGYSKDELLKMQMLDLIAKVEIPKIKRTLEMNKRVQKNHLEVFPTIHRKKSGELINVEIHRIETVFNGKRAASAIVINNTEKMLQDNAISKAIIKTQEDDRYEIGSELHDNISQILVASQLSLGLLQKSVDASKINLLSQSRDYISKALSEIRNLSHRLAPVIFENKTLEDSFYLLLQQMNQDEKYRFKIQFDKKFEKKNISTQIQLNLYRILQEQVKNILNHSKATYVEAGLKIINNIIVFKIADNGIGFNTATKSNGIGLSNIKRRAELFGGKMEIQSSPGNGCIIEICIPFR